MFIIKFCFQVVLILLLISLNVFGQKSLVSLKDFTSVDLMKEDSTFIIYGLKSGTVSLSKYDGNFNLLKDVTQEKVFDAKTVSLDIIGENEYSIHVLGKEKAQIITDGEFNVKTSHDWLKKDERKFRKGISDEQSLGYQHKSNASYRYADTIVDVNCGKLKYYKKKTPFEFDLYNLVKTVDLNLDFCKVTYEKWFSKNSNSPILYIEYGDKQSIIKLDIKTGKELFNYTLGATDSTINYFSNLTQDKNGNTYIIETVFKYRKKHRFICTGWQIVKLSEDGEVLQRTHHALPNLDFFNEKNQDESICTAKDMHIDENGILKFIMRFISCEAPNSTNGQQTSGVNVQTIGYGYYEYNGTSTKENLMDLTSQRDKLYSITITFYTKLTIGYPAIISGGKFYGKFEDFLFFDFNTNTLIYKGAEEKISKRINILKYNFESYDTDELILWSPNTNAPTFHNLTDGRIIYIGATDGIGLNITLVE